MQLNDIKSMLLAGANSINVNKDKINKVNVFPIPDGDTGTNMDHTMGGIVKKLMEIGDADLTEESFDQLYNSALMASQGNSGVILSQWYKGFFGAFKENMELTIGSLDEAFMLASEAAYSAVSNPTEGTILTVAREGFEGAEEQIDEESTVEQFLEAVLNCAKESLERTPELLPVLKDAGVIDSGGLGFVYMISGMLEGINGSSTFDVDDLLEQYGTITSGIDISSDSEEFGYCTELILNVSDDKKSVFHFEDQKKWCENIGNSVVAVMNLNQFKAHVHTMEPEKVLEHFHSFGEFYKIKIENMTVQHHELQNFSEKKTRKEGLSIITVADGPGMKSLFSDMGANIILDGGQSDNVSVEDMVNAIKATDTNTVVLLPNNKNILMAAEKAKENTQSNDLDVIILPTKTMADGYAAMALVDFEAPAFEIMDVMKQSLAKSISCQIAPAARDSVCDGIEVKSGELLVVVDGTVIGSVVVVEDALEVLQAKLSGIENKSSVVFFCKDEEAIQGLECIRNKIDSVFGSAEIFFYNGGQTVYDYVLAII